MNAPMKICLGVSAGLLVASAGGMSAAGACPGSQRAPESPAVEPAPPAPEAELLRVSAPRAVTVPMVHAVHTSGQHGHTVAPAVVTQGVYNSQGHTVTASPTQNIAWTFDGDDDGTDRVVIVSSDNGEKYEVRVKDGDVRVKHNGKVVGPERVRMGGGIVEVLGDDGETVRTFRLAPRVASQYAAPGNRQRIAWATSGEPVIVSAPEGASVGWVSDNTPPVMVGINQSEVSDALRWQLRLPKERQAILVERVIEGLPAEEAGLNRYDVILSVEGSEGASGQILSKVLRSKEPGDEIELIVISKGDKKKIHVELAPYDSRKLGIARTLGAYGDAQNRFFADAPDADDRFEYEFDHQFDFDNHFSHEYAEKIERELAERYEDLHRLYEKHGHGMQEEARRQAEEAVKQMQEAVRERIAMAEEHARAAQEHARERALELRGDRLVFPERLDERFSHVEADLEDRLDQLEERLDVLNDVLEDRMSDMMDRLSEMMDELQDELEEIQDED